MAEALGRELVAVLHVSPFDPVRRYARRNRERKVLAPAEIGSHNAALLRGSEWSRRQLRITFSAASDERARVIRLASSEDKGLLPGEPPT